MSLLRHVVRKDIRVAGGLWLVWIGVVVLHVAWQIVGARAMADNGLRLTSVSATRVALPLAELIMVLLIATRVVHDDPVDPHAFWLTRPIGAGRLAAAKIASVLLLVLAPALAAESLLLLWLGVPLVDLVRILFELAIAIGLPTCLALVAAALASNQVQYLLLLVGALVAPLVAWNLVRIVVPPPAVGQFLVPPRPPDAVRTVVIYVVLLAGLMWIVRLHYVRRDRRVAAGGLLLVVAAAIVVARVWPDLGLLGGVPAARGAWTDPAVTRLRRLDDRLYMAPFRGNGRRIAAAPIVLEGLPDDYTAKPETMEGRLEYADGTVATIGRSSSIQMQARGDYEPSLSLAYGPTTLPSGPTVWEVWPVVVEVPVDVLHRKRHEPGKYEGRFAYRLAHHERLATLPIEVGATHRDGARSLVIRRALDSTGFCVVTVQMYAPELRLTRRDEPTLGYHVVDRRTGAPLRMERHNRGISAGAKFLPTFSLRDNLFASWYEQITTYLQRLGPVPGAAAPQTCADTGLVVVRTTPAGTLYRTLELADFRLTPTSDPLDPR